MLDLNKECGRRHTVQLIAQGERRFKIRATWKDETPYVMLTTVHGEDEQWNLSFVTELVEEKDGEPDRIIYTEYDGGISVPGIWDNPEDAIAMFAYNTDEEFEMLLLDAEQAGKL